MITFENKMTWYVRCRCPDKCHLIVLEYDEEIGPSWSTAQDVRPWGVWSRIKQAWKFVFGKADMCWNDGMIDEAGADQIRDWLWMGRNKGFGTDWKNEDNK